MASYTCLINLCIVFFVYCFTSRYADSLSVCSPQTVKCNSTLICIDSLYLCDGDDDCGDGEDELNCNVRGLKETVTAVTRQPPIPSSQPVCGDVTELTNGLGYILSPSFADNIPYPAPIQCRWRIKVQPTYYVTLRVEILDLGVGTSDGCKNGWLELYDGHDDNSAMIGLYCGHVLPTQDLSTSNEVFIVMTTTNNTDSQRGFVLYYEAHLAGTTTVTTLGPQPPGCNGDPIIITSSQGYITSPNFNETESYRVQLDCEWILLGKPGQVFYFTFHDFEIEDSKQCSFDFLSFYDIVSNDSHSSSSGDEFQHTLQVNNNISDSQVIEIAKVCGRKLPYEVESNGNRVFIKFNTDGDYGGRGFNFSYVQQPPTVRCHEEDEFQCGNLDCIQYSLVCNGVPDCTDGTDELICATSASCGHPAIKPVLSRIVGGTEAVDGAWPWTVSLVKSTPQPNSHDCGASLILPQWALTAAHCFDNVYSRVYDGYYLIGGRHEVNIPDKNEQIRAFDQVFIHHQYDVDTVLNDIALVKLKEPFNLTDHISLVCLPQNPAQEGKMCYITGWGDTMSTCCANQLKQAGVPIMNSTLCAQDDYYGSGFLEHMMCAGYTEGGVDTCSGDSGGPLVCETETQDRHWEVHGITSWGMPVHYTSDLAFIQLSMITFSGFNKIWH